mmetsp:Transcript_15336/g.30541  ORF Transcript_15336/g.30541 Transcript_15336/m.30541 type:complete len:222 (+) Transcript_15336:679-1344(+)
MRLPKNFQPVGVSKRERLRSFATRSTAPDVGMLLATDFRPPCAAKNGILLAFAAITARESEGVTKNCVPRIMFLSPSPSAAAPNDGTDLPAMSIGLPFLSRPMVATSSLAYVRLGSAWPPLKSSLGSLFIMADWSRPKHSQNTFRAYGPLTPCMLSYTMVKSSRLRRAWMAGKSKMDLRRATWASVVETTSTLTSRPPSLEITLVAPGVERSMAGNDLQML